MRSLCGNACGALPRVEKAPTCYRAPRWPDPEFPQKIPKKYRPLAETLWNPEKIPLNAPKLPQNTDICGISGVVVRYFGGIFSGPEFWARGRYFSWKFWVGLLWGSVAGRGVLKLRVHLPRCYTRRVTYSKLEDERMRIRLEGLSAHSPHGWTLLPCKS